MSNIIISWFEHDVLMDEYQELENSIPSLVEDVHMSTTQSSETWHDNPLFDISKEALDTAHNRMHLIKSFLAEAVVIDRTLGSVSLGDLVTAFINSGKEVQYRIISGEITLQTKDKTLSLKSSVGKLFLGKHVGSEFVSPANTNIIYKIHKID